MTRTSLTRRAMLGASALMFTGAATAVGPALGAVSGRTAEVASPDGRLRLRLSWGEGGPRWSVLKDRRVLMQPSPLGLVLADGRRLGPEATCEAQTRAARTDAYAPVFGTDARYDASHRELVLRFRDPATRIAFDIVARAYDAGVAIRYRMVSLPGGAARFGDELTGFLFPPGVTLYASRDEGDYQVCAPAQLAPVADPPLTESADHGPFADLPVTVKFGDGACALITESDRQVYPRAQLVAQDDALTIRTMRYPARATGWGGQDLTPPEPEFTLGAGVATPWRVLLTADRPAALMEKYGLIPSLAAPSRIKDAAWVRPGRAIRIRAPYTTEASLRTVDFAAAHKLEYVMYDAHWYGDGTDASDASYPVAGLDLLRVIAYGAQKNIGVILYVDRVPVSRQLEQICALYQQWGVKGVKFGFVWEGRQSDDAFILKIIETCARRKLLVNLHDDLRPAGLERTWPNYIALEGVRGNEHFPTPRHNVTLPFTRSVAGPLDYTICYANPRNQTTNAHQLAMAAVYYNPLTFLYWYDSPDKYAGKPWPELRWFDECPTTWHETRGLDGEIGEYVLVARRHGQRWFIGAMTNEKARRLTCDLSFLAPGKWRAEIFRDGAPASPAWTTGVVMEEKIVDRAAVLTLNLNAAGGQAVLLTPVETA